MTETKHYKNKIIKIKRMRYRRVESEGERERVGKLCADNELEVSLYPSSFSLKLRGRARARAQAQGSRVA